jgi:putative flavoprotein involved in K+ transport
MADMRSSTVVIGAGAAGLAVSRALTDTAVDHVVLERRGIADTWRNQRWDSFRLNTPGWMNTMLGPVEPHSFSYRDEVVRLLEKQAAGLPVQTGVPVTSLDRDGADFVVRTPDGQIRAATVVVASGGQNVALRPDLGAALTSRITQLDAADYRSADQLPDGAVLVVGGAQSGSQIAEDLAVAGREVYFSTSRVGRYPWIYRGRELLAWLDDVGFWDQRVSDLAHPEDARTAFPVVASGGRDLDVRILAGLGVQLLGRLERADGDALSFAGSVAEHAAYADQIALRLQGMADDFIAARGIDAPEPEPADLSPVPEARIDGLDLGAAGVSTVIWCTGFTGDLSWVRLPIGLDRGWPQHDGCASLIPGLWYAGFVWLTRRRSGILHGFPVDAAEIANAVIRHLT